MLTIAWATEATSQDPNTGAATSESTEHVLQFDAVVSEKVDATSAITENAVGGRSIADHKHVSAPTISLDCIVTNTPLGQPPPSGYGPIVSALESPITLESGGSVLGFTEPFNRVGDVLDTLLRLVSEPTVVDVFTDLRDYSNMTVVGVGAPRTLKDSIRFTVELAQVRTVATATVDIPPAREPRGARTRNAGAQEATDAQAASSPGVSQSALSQITEDVDGGADYTEAVSNALFGGGS